MFISIKYHLSNPVTTERAFQFIMCLINDAQIYS